MDWDNRDPFGLFRSRECTRCVELRSGCKVRQHKGAVVPGDRRQLGWAEMASVLE